MDRDLSRSKDVRVDFAGRRMLAAYNIAYEMPLQHTTLRPTSHKFKITRGTNIFQKISKNLCGEARLLHFINVSLRMSPVRSCHQIKTSTYDSPNYALINPDWHSRCFVRHKSINVEASLETAGRRERESLSVSLKVARFHWSRTRKAIPWSGMWTTRERATGGDGLGRIWSCWFIASEMSVPIYTRANNDSVIDRVNGRLQIFTGTPEKSSK